MTEVLINNRILTEIDETVICEDLEEEEILISSQMEEDAILIATDTRECEPLLSNGGGGIHEIVYNQFIGRP